jgi:hypothetical protein
MSNHEPEFNLAGMLADYHWSSDLADAVLERAKANAIKLDGIGMASMPDASQRSLLIEAFNQLEAEKVKPVPKITPEKLERIEAAKLAFGKRGQDAPLRHRGEFLKKYGEAEFEIERAKWGVNLKSLAPGKNPYKSELRAAEAGEIKKSAKSGDSGSKETNPWKLDGPEGVAARAAFVAKMPTRVSIDLAKAAGKRLDGQPLA